MSIISCQQTDTAFVKVYKKAYDYSADTFKIAFYGSTASLDKTTTAYTATGELSGGGYTAGGYALSGNTVSLVNGTLCISFSDYTTAAAITGTVYGWMVYHSATSDAISIVGLATPVTFTAQQIVVRFPQTTAGEGLIAVRRVA